MCVVCVCVYDLVCVVWGVCEMGVFEVSLLCVCVVCECVGCVFL